MPKTASKRAQARKMARVSRAHAVAPERPVVRRTPSAQRKRSKPRGFAAFVSNYPWATTIFTVAVVVVIVVILRAQQVGPFAPAKPKPVVQVTCDLKTHACTGAPKMTINTANLYTATIKTAKGDIVVQLDPKKAPIAVNNFVFLAQSKWYDGTYFWRVETPGKPSPIDPSGTPSTLSLIQGGSVTKNGQDPASMPGYTIEDQNPIPADYTPGTVAMAEGQNPNSASTQFFIDIGDETQYFAKSYVTFGKVISGMDVVKKIAPQDVIQTITISVQTPANATATAGASGSTPSATGTSTSATATATPKP